MIYLVQQYLDHSAATYPNRIAVACGESGIAYAELYHSSNQLANCLWDHGIDRQDRVAIFLRRSPNYLIALMGVLKADAIYVPIDPKWPAERWMKIIDDCAPSALLCDGETIDKITPLLSSGKDHPKIFILEERENIQTLPKVSFISQSEIQQTRRECPLYRNVDTDLAYILYTSGSTGSPKGVMISHLNIINYIEWATDCFGMTHQDILLGTAPFHFDMSTFDIYCTLKSGAKFCIAPENFLLFPTRLLALMERECITLWKGVSSLLIYIAQNVTLKEKILPNLKQILFGGEVLPTKYLIQWMEAFPDKLFFNVYGPTEATGISTYFWVKDIPNNASESIPIGRACKNTEVFLLKEDRSLAEVGEMGELYIRGSGLSRGYWNDKEKTKDSFISNPVSKIPEDRVYRTGDLATLKEDGNYQFLGRRDDQVKSLGYRINLSDIEMTLRSLEPVKDAAVVLSPSDDHSTNGLVAFIVTNGRMDSHKILAELSGKIPRYMLPQRVLSITHIPRTDRGKIDRQALKNLLSPVVENQKDDQTRSL